MVYVFDPKALHNIVVKDQYIYEETPVFLTAVFKNVVVTFYFFGFLTPLDA